MVANRIIVIGASAGGVEALKQLARLFSPDIAAPVLIVLHTSPHTPSLMPKILNHNGTLSAQHAVDGQSLENGQIYIAPPDYHLLVRDGYMELSNGPKENGFRPAIDVLFRTAAKVYRERAIGVILTGALDNGSAGLLSIKARGGIGIVQDPEEALYPDMPRNAIKAAPPDYILPLNEIPATLKSLVNTPSPAKALVPLESDTPIHDETTVTENVYQEPGRRVSTLTCPDCGGVLAEYDEQRLLHYKCRVGHAYAVETLLAIQSETLENALWEALRLLEENIDLLQRMADRSRQANDPAQIQERFASRAESSRQHAAVLRDVLLR